MCAQAAALQPAFGITRSIRSPCVLVRCKSGKSYLAPTGVWHEREASHHTAGVGLLLSCQGRERGDTPSPPPPRGVWRTRCCVAKWYRRLPTPTRHNKTDRSNKVALLVRQRRGEKVTSPRRTRIDYRWCNRTLCKELTGSLQRNIAEFGCMLGG